MLTIEHDFRIEIKIISRNSKQSRRDLLLLCYKHILPVIPYVWNSRLIHSETPLQTAIDRDFDRVVTLTRCPANHPNDPEATGIRLRLTRRKLGWNQQQLALYLGISRSQVSRIEKGHHIPSASNAKQIQILFERVQKVD